MRSPKPSDVLLWHAGCVNAARSLLLNHLCPLEASECAARRLLFRPAMASSGDARGSTPVGAARWAPRALLAVLLLLLLGGASALDPAVVRLRTGSIDTSRADHGCAS